MKGLILRGLPAQMWRAASVMTALPDIALPMHTPAWPPLLQRSCGIALVGAGGVAVLVRWMAGAANATDTARRCTHAIVWLELQKQAQSNSEVGLQICACKEVR